MEAEIRVEGKDAGEWSEEDQKWLRENVKFELKGIALRYGRQLFSMALRVGLMNHCFAVLSQRLQKNPELMQMVGLLAQAVNDQSGLALTTGLGKTMQELMECKVDIERVGAMIQASPTEQAKMEAALQGKKMSPGGIILDS